MVESYLKEKYQIRNTHPSREEHRLAVDLHRRWSCTSTSYMTLNSANSIFVEEGGEAYIAYRQHLGVAITIGEPVGAPLTIERCIDQFLDLCKSRHWLPVFFAIENHHHLYKQRKLKAIQVAEDTYLDLEGLEFKGKRWQDVRTALNRAAREQLNFCQFRPNQCDAGEIRQQIEQISSQWLQGKKLPELCFMLGSTDTITDPAIRTFYVINSQKRVQGFVSWLPFSKERGWSLDLMRRQPAAMPGVMEFLIANSALQFRQEGYTKLGLGAAPLAPIQCPRKSSKLEFLIHQTSNFLSSFYHFENLYAFKRKFQPEWKPLFMFYAPTRPLALFRVGLALLLAYLLNPDKNKA